MDNAHKKPARPVPGNPVATPDDRVYCVPSCPSYGEPTYSEPSCPWRCRMMDERVVLQELIRKARKLEFNAFQEILEFMADVFADEKMGKIHCIDCNHWVPIDTACEEVTHGLCTHEESGSVLPGPAERPYAITRMNDYCSQAEKKEAAHED